jgi:hypothetical protein
VLHLRKAPGKGPDLATGRLPSSQALEENPWYLFQFPPIADSQDKAFYIEVESPDGTPENSLTLFWWQQVAGSDPYAHGTAYLDGTPEKADLAFGLRYSGSPLQSWAQLARAASVNFPLPMMLVILALALPILVGLGWALWRLPRAMRDGEHRTAWLWRGSLPLSLALALLSGATYMFLVPPWQGPDEHSHFAYAALLDRHDLDDKKVQSLQLWGKDRDEALFNAVTRSMNSNDFSRRVIWHSLPGAPVSPGATLLQELRQQPTYYWLCAAALRVARAAGIQADPYLHPVAALYVMRGVSLLLSLFVVALAWLAGLLLGGVGRPWLHLLLPLTVALLPMPAFIASVANNDILAEIAAAALFVTLAALFRWPAGVRGLGLAALAVLITVASSKTKSTALAACVPLLALGMVAWTGMVITHSLRRWISRARWRAAVVPAGIIAVAGAVAIGAGSSAYSAESTAAAWNLKSWPYERAARVETTSAHHGAYVIQLGPENAGRRASQVLVPPVYHPALTVTLSGWVRLAPDQVVAPGSAVTAAIEIEEGSRRAGLGEVTLDSASAWVPISTTASISESAEQVVLYLSGGGSGAAVQFDDLTLDVMDARGPWKDPIYSHPLLNPSAEVAGVGLRPDVAKLLPEDARQIADTLVNPQPINRGGLWAYYADAQYRSFWGNFGWVSVPLPEILYPLLGVLTVSALSGLLWSALRRVGRWSADAWLGLISLVALLSAVLIGFAKQAMLLVAGAAAYPQGRYLFVLIVPLVWLLLSGLWPAWSGIWCALTMPNVVRRAGAEDGHSEMGSSPHSRGALPWGAWLWINIVIMLATYCVLSLLAPFYYG